MLALIGVLGGAAAIELRKLGRKPNHEQLQHLKVKEKALEELVETLQKELHEEKETSKDVEHKLQSLIEEREQLAEQSKQLHSENASLKCTSTFLVLEHMLVKKQCKDLTTQLERKALDMQLQSSAHGDEMLALRSHVAQVMDNFLSKRISDTEAAQELQDLGCDLVFVDQDSMSEASSASDEHPHHTSAAIDWSCQPQLLLDNKERIHRLMAAGKASALAAADGRVPLVMFPQLKGPAITAPQLMHKLAAMPPADSQAPALTAAVCSGKDDGLDQNVKRKDQHRVMTIGAPKSSPPKSSKGVKFVYQAQTHPGQQWSAKLPGGGSTEHAPPSAGRSLFLKDQDSDLFSDDRQLSVRF